MKINVIYNKYIPDYETVLARVETALINQNAEFKSFDLEAMDNYGDISVVIGGDGTILKAARYYSETKIPVMGINMGRLGFLSQAGFDKTELVTESLLGGEYYTEERIMLTSQGKLALNDFVIKGCNPSRTSKFYLEINGRVVCDYIADGLIVATPTGSTAYGLSAGGPILHPVTDCLAIVPICPHTLNTRPMVIPAEEKISVKTSDMMLSVSVDGYETFECIDKISINKSEKKAYLAFLKTNNFYSVLRDKLYWGNNPY